MPLPDGGDLHTPWKYVGILLADVGNPKFHDKVIWWGKIGLNFCC